jgi:hypothetical protein
MKSLKGGRITKGDGSIYITLSGDFKPTLAEYAKHFDLTEKLSIGVYRIQTGQQLARENIDFIREAQTVRQERPGPSEYPRSRRAAP